MIVINSKAEKDVIEERRQQYQHPRITRTQDDTYVRGELARAALNYTAAAAIVQVLGGGTYSGEPPLNGWGSSISWPFPYEWWKPGTPRRMLVKAGALILAEIERLDRAEAAANGKQASA